MRRSHDSVGEAKLVTDDAHGYMPHESCGMKLCPMGGIGNGTGT